jgi:hypothetical protein
MRGPSFDVTAERATRTWGTGPRSSQETHHVSNRVTLLIPRTTLNTQMHCVAAFNAHVRNPLSSASFGVTAAATACPQKNAQVNLSLQHVVEAYMPETLWIPHSVDNRLTEGGEVVSLTRNPRFTPPPPKEDSLFSFVAEIE